MKVLAVSWHTGGANAIIPVIRELRNTEEVVVIAKGPAQQAFERAGLEYNFGLITDIIQNYHPDILLTGTSMQDSDLPTIEQQAILAAKELGIPSISVLDFWANYSNRFSDIYSGGHLKFLPDRVAVMDSYALEAMLAEGFPRESLIVTDNPHFETLKSTMQEEHNPLKVFFPGGVLRVEKESAGYWDLDVLRMLAGQDAECIYKPHPGTPQDDLILLETYARDHGIAVESGAAPLQLVQASDLVVVEDSTLGVEAAYMGKPVISLKPGAYSEGGLARLTEDGTIPVGYTETECKELVEEAISNPDYRSELVSRLSKLKQPIGATSRVISEMYNLAKRTA